MANSKDDNILVTAAKTVGRAAGKIAALAGAEAAPSTSEPKATKPGKLAPKQKNRLPRKVKKQRQKAAA